MGKWNQEERDLHLKGYIGYILAISVEEQW